MKNIQECKMEDYLNKYSQEEVLKQAGIGGVFRATRNTIRSYSKNRSVLGTNKLQDVMTHGAVGAGLPATMMGGTAIGGPAILAGGVLSPLALVAKGTATRLRRAKALAK